MPTGIDPLLPGSRKPGRVARPGRVTTGQDLQEIHRGFWFNLRHLGEWLEGQRWFTPATWMVYIGSWLVLFWNIVSFLSAVFTPLSYKPPANDYRDAWYKAPLPQSMPYDDWVGQSIWATIHALLVMVLFTVVVIFVSWVFLGVNTRNKGRMVVFSGFIFWLALFQAPKIAGAFAWGPSALGGAIAGLEQIVGIALLVVAVVLVRNIITAVTSRRTRRMRDL